MSYRVNPITNYQMTPTTDDMTYRVTKSVILIDVSFIFPYIPVLQNFLILSICHKDLFNNNMFLVVIL